MDEEEFEKLIKPRSFGTNEAKQADFHFRRRALLATSLFGKEVDDLRRQLLTPFPEIPLGFDLADFHELLRFTAEISAAMGTHQKVTEFRTIVVGTQRYTEWEAQCEIIRRAINYLENR